MRIRGALRLTLAWLALPTAVACAVWCLGNGDSAAAEGYPLAYTTQAVSSMVLIGPLLAGLAVMAGNRWVAGGWRAVPTARPRGLVALDVLWPLVAAGGCGLIAVAILGVPEGRADLRVMGAAMALVSALAVLGFGVGARAPMAWAAPAVIVATYLFFALPLIVEPLWLRQITGMWSGCCAVDQDLDPGSVAAVLTVAAALGGAGAILGFTRRSALVAVALATSGFAAGAGLVARGGPDPVVPRDPDLLACSEGLCLWPEHEAARSRALLAVTAVDRAGWHLGLGVPATYSEADPAGFGGLVADPRRDDASLRLAATSALIPDYSAACAARLESAGAPAYPYEVLAAARGVVATRAGLSVEELEERGYDETAIATVQQLADLPNVGRWLRQVQVDIRRCQPHDLPLGSP